MTDGDGGQYRDVRQPGRRPPPSPGRLLKRWAIQAVVVIVFIYATMGVGGMGPVLLTFGVCVGLLWLTFLVLRRAYRG